MRELLRWAIPGLVVVGPLQLLIGAWEPLSWPAALLASAPIGFTLGQAVRWRFESRRNGYRNPQRPALAAIIERAQLGHRADAGDVAYQVFETTLYLRTDWGAARDHAHRCWDWIYLFQSTALGSAVGAVLSVLALLAGPHRLLAALLLVALPAAAAMLVDKARQTEEALHLFDRALVVANWPAFDAVLRAMSADGEGSASE